MEKNLVVGGSGFLGLNWLEYLRQQGSENEVVVFAYEKPEGIEFPSFVIFEEGDYADAQALEDLFSKHSFDRVFHFASSIIPAISSENIRQDIESNLLPTIGLMEMMKKHQVSKLLYLSTGGAVYGNVNQEKVPENYPCKPISSYGIIKLAVEHYIELYAKLYQIDYLILRLSNPFGSFHRSTKQGVINIAVRKALKGEVMTVWGDGSQAKDYIYARDIGYAMAQLIQAGVKNETINVGSGESLTLNAIIKRIQNKLPAFQVEYKDAKLTDVQKICLDTAKLAAKITWETTSFDEALEKTIAYEKSRLS
ncbi:MAG: UDP-glucose 4-epimerase [Bacteroidota bacterium]